MHSSEHLERYVARAREMGALDARLVDSSSVVTDPWVRWKCQYGCGGFNSNLCCPPHSPTPEQTRRVLDSYRRALLVRGTVGSDIHRWVIDLERELFLDGYYKAFALSSGPCSLCKECNRDRCARPGEARPSMEACGIDVFATVRKQNLPINVVTDRAGDQDCYGLLLIE